MKQYLAFGLGLLVNAGGLLAQNVTESVVLERPTWVVHRRGELQAFTAPNATFYDRFERPSYLGRVRVAIQGPYQECLLLGAHAVSNKLAFKIMMDDNTATRTYERDQNGTFLNFHIHASNVNGCGIN